MRSFKNGLFLVSASLVLSSCGGGGGSETSVSFESNSPPIAQSAYDVQTKAARAQFEKRLSDALTDAETWLDDNRRESGVTTTASGLQYRIEKSSPNPTGKRYESDETVTVHYEGRLIDGTIFDSSFERGRPEKLKPSDLIQGWQEALNLMHPGDEWTVFVPPALGYGDLGKGGGVPPNAVLIFKIQLR